MTDQSELRDRIAAAVASVTVTIGPNSLTLLEHGHTLGLSSGEVDSIAFAVLAVVQPELDRLHAGLNKAISFANLGAKCFKDGHGALLAEARAIAGGEKFRADRAEAERVTARRAGLIDAADVLDRIAAMQECIDDDQARVDAGHTRSSARAIRTYAATKPVVE